MLYRKATTFNCEICSYVTDDELEICQHVIAHLEYDIKTLNEKLEAANKVETRPRCVTCGCVIDSIRKGRKVFDEHRNCVGFRCDPCDLRLYKEWRASEKCSTFIGKNSDCD